MARDQGWYEPDDEVDAALPYLTRDLGWDDLTWKANEHSFGLSARTARAGTARARGRRCEVLGRSARDRAPAARTSGRTSSPTPRSGSGAEPSTSERPGPFLRVQADGESLPFADGAFDVTYCVATLHHALDLGRMVGEMARVTRRGGHVLALNEGTRAVYRSATLPTRPRSGRTGSTSTCTRSTRTSGRSPAPGLVVRRVEQADGYEEMAGRRIGGRLLRLPRSAAARRPGSRRPATATRARASSRAECADPR